MACRAKTGITNRVHAGHGVYNFIFHGWKVIELNLGSWKKNLLSENKKAKRSETS